MYSPVGSRHISVRFDFMFVKPRDVPPMFCFNVQTDMWFFYYNSLWHQTVFKAYPLGTGVITIKKFLVSLHVKAKHRRHFAWFTNIKSNQNMPRSDWKCFPVHNQSKWTFPRTYQKGGEWVTQCEQGNEWVCSKLKLLGNAWECLGNKMSIDKTVERSVWRSWIKRTVMRISCR